MRFLPHAVAPSKQSAHLAICYKNFAANKGISHIGLGVTALTNARILQSAGFWAEVWPILSAADLIAKIKQSRALQAAADGVPLSHCVISAPWLPTADIAALAREYNDIDFTIVSHSNIGFLQADTNGLRLLREAGDLQTGTTNVHIGANCRKLIEWWQGVYRNPMRYLGNMYDLSAAIPYPQKRQPGGLLRIGSFSAVRPLKNILTAGAAALEIASRAQADNLEFWISANRTEGGGQTIVAALQAMFANLPNAKLMQSGWQSWPEFRRVVRSMNLLIQPSYTESFCMVVADGVAEGVPSVVSEAIDWVPSRWQAASDDAIDIANVGFSLLWNPTATQQGLAALRAHNADALASWSSILLAPLGAGPAMAGVI